MTEGALKGIRVLDLTQVAVGPYATLFLGFLGAEVIKIESCRRADSSRGPVKPAPNQYFQYPGRQPGERPWDQHCHYAQRNRNKLSISLDVGTDEGKELLKKLVGHADALVENYRASVLERWGLSYEALSEINPRLLYLKLSSQGNTGPERDYGSLGSTLECTSGLSSITGYLGSNPLMSNETFPDPAAGILAVGALMAGIRRRRKTGRGALIDLSQREMTTCLIGEYVMDFAMNGRRAGPLGNRHQTMAPHGVYPCVGEDSWVAIAVGSDEEWQGLCRAMGNPTWTTAPEFGDALSRWHNQDEIDRRLADWTREQGHYDVMHLLQQHGVPSGAVIKGGEVVRDPHLVERDWWDRIVSPEVGREYAYVGTPWSLSKNPRLPSRPAPPFGEHNHYVYCEILGLSEGEVAELDAKGIISTTPMW